MSAIAEETQTDTARNLLTPNEYLVSMQATQIDKREMDKLLVYRPECDEPAYLSLDDESSDRR
jgi:hypothetical protein